MLAQRIKEIRKALKLTQEQLAEKTSATRPMIASYELNRVVPNDVFIRHFCKTLNVNEDWLRTGIGEMFIPIEGDAKLMDIIADACMNDREDVKQTIVAISELDTEQLEAIRKIIELMKKNSS